MMNKKLKLIFSIVLLLVLFSFVISSAGCSKVTSYSTPMTLNLLNSISSENYANFSKDFDEALKQELSETNFPDLVLQMKDNFGTYKENSLKFKGFNYVNGVNTVDYTADFTNKSGVSVQVIFTKVNDQMKISGLWFK
ncbi:MAG: DUF3887 domain-containing protein [Candidatus Humimicrobiaceae bacterium]